MPSQGAGRGRRCCGEEGGGREDEVLCVTRAKWEGKIAGVQVSGVAVGCIKCSPGQAVCGIIGNPGSLGTAGPPVAPPALL